MIDFFRHRVYRAGIAIVIAEIIVLGLVGSFSIYNISEAVDSRVESQVQIPGQLMDAGLLDFDAVEDSVQMSELVGEEFIDGMVIGIDYNVYYSLNPDYLGQSAEDIPTLDTSLLNIQNPSEVIHYTNGNLISVTIIYGLDGVTPRFFVYVVVGNGVATAEKNQSAQMFLLGAGVIVALTFTVVALSFGLIQRLEQDLTAKERLAVLGELGAGVSHEIRNPLGSIKTAAYYLRMTIDNPSNEIKETIGILERESQRIEHIVNSLLRYAHPKPPLMILASYKEIVKEVLTEISIPDDVKIVNQLESDGPKAFADFNQMVMACRLIITNALQAMSEGGQLTIGSKTEGRDWAVLSIADTGIGIPAESIKKIFDPLFTTKAQGIGLGLPIAKSLVDGHKGTIDVQSKVGKGTVFFVKLPLAHSAAPLD
ncbi:MAG: hypothetical protein E3J86_03245 [Candidatus Thorarchaeota archaeon]|nr:MAG: hypothetical protein E3J86_03245 [Candidatus Thorarchaeota archaeon]